MTYRRWLTLDIATHGQTGPGTVELSERLEREFL